MVNAWMTHVKKTRMSMKGAALKDVLKAAKKTYKKQKGGSGNINHDIAKNTLQLGGETPEPDPPEIDKPLDDAGTLPPDATQNLDSDGNADNAKPPADADPIEIIQSQNVSLGGKKHRRRTRKKSKKRKRRRKTRKKRKSRKKRKQKQKGGQRSTAAQIKALQELAKTMKPTAEKNASRADADDMKELVNDFDKENPPEPTMGSPEEAEKLQVDAAPADAAQDGPVPSPPPPQSGGAKIAKHPFNAKALLAAVTDKKPAEEVLPEESGTITVDGHAAAAGIKSSGFHGGKKHKRKTRKKRKKGKKKSRKKSRKHKRR